MLIVQFVHDLVRDAVADCVGFIVQSVVEIVATLGVGLSAALAQVGSLVAKWARRLATDIEDLIRSIGKLAKHFHDADGLLQAIRNLFMQIQARRTPANSPSVPARTSDSFPEGRSPAAGDGGPRAGGGGDSGPWTATASNRHAATPEDGVTVQVTDVSCVAAAGDMLTHGEPSQSDLLNAFGDPDGITTHSVSELVIELRPAYDGGWFSSEEEAVKAARRGPLAANLQAPGGGGHMIYIEPVSEGKFLVRDPWGQGSVYTVDENWVAQYLSAGVWKV